MGLARRGPERVLGARLVPEVALEVRDLRARDQFRLDVLGAELGRRAEVGVERPLRIGGHDDQAPARGRPVRCRARDEADAGRADVVGEHAAELIVADPADEGRRTAERRDTDHRVGGGTTGDLRGRAHRLVQELRPIGVDQGHRAFDEPVLGQEVVGLVAEHVDQRVAETGDVERGRLCQIEICGIDGHATGTRFEMTTGVPVTPAAPTTSGASGASGEGVCRCGSSGRRRRPTVSMRP